MQWLQAVSQFHTAFVALDDAYQRSLASLSTQTIAEKDEERDVWGRCFRNGARKPPSFSFQTPKGVAD